MESTLDGGEWSQRLTIDARERSNAEWSQRTRRELGSTNWVQRLTIDARQPSNELGSTLDY